jgi:NPCBM/NEW2 domain
MFLNRIGWIVTVICVGVAGIARSADLRPWNEVVAVEGVPFKARLQAISAEGMISWELRGGEVKKRPLAGLCWWGEWAETRPQTQVVLVDGSLIVAEVIGIGKEHLAADWSLGGNFKLPLEWVGGILLEPPVDRQQADLMRSIVAFRSAKERSFAERKATLPSDTDRLILLNGDELTGEILALDESTVKIRTTAGEVSVAKEKIAAAAFNPSLAAKPNPADARFWIGFQDGSRVLAASLAIERETAKIKLAAGPQIDVPAAKIVAIQPLAGHNTYLSDLKSAGYQHIPFLDLTWPYRTDRNVLGSQLRAGGKLFLKGLGMHSAARLNYNLDKPYRKFAAEAAIDDQTAGRGSALFRVYADDGSGQWQLKYEGPIVRGGAAPVPISVDLAGVKRLSLLVDFADHGDEQAHADWLNARLLP